MKKDVLGVKIDDISLGQAIEAVLNLLKKPGKHYIVTPNPEFLVAAQKDKKFINILNDADLSIPDGIGLKLFGGLKNRVSGVDLVEGLIKESFNKGYTIGFLGGQKGIAKKAAECLRQRYQNISIVFAEDGGQVDFEGNSSGQNIPKLDILFVAFGQVKQEKWIANNLEKVPVKVLMGVGRTFDYLSGGLVRAPKWVRILGFEWLFSLILQPWRIKRQFALLKYLYLLMLH